MRIKLNLRALCLLFLVLASLPNFVFAKENSFDADKRKGSFLLAQDSVVIEGKPLTIEDSPNDPANAWRGLLNGIFIAGIAIAIIWFILSSLGK